MARDLPAPLAPTAGSVRRGSRPARVLLPELSNLWIRYAPRLGRAARRWPGPAAPWLDLSRGGRLVWQSGGEEEGEFPSLPEGPLDDVLYLPPVAAARRPALDAVATSHLERGTPVLMQRLPGDPPPPAGAVAVWDPTAVLLAGDELAGDGVVAESLAAGDGVLLWPLVPGFSDRPETLEDALSRLAGGAGTVHPLAVPLDPADRRRLLDHASGADREDLFDRLFHGPRPNPRDACRRIAARRLAPWPDRPLPRPPLPGAAARRAVGWLTLAAELHHRLGRTMAAHRGFLAARSADQVRDLEALGRDGHLDMLPAVGEEERRFLARALEGKPSQLTALEKEYLEE